MKKQILLFTCVAAISYLTLSSHSNGPANNGYNRTGAKGTAATCGGGGCHGTGTGPTVSIMVHSGSTMVSNYHAGQTYSIHIHGSGTTNNHFGFQFCAVTGTGSAQATTGTYGTLPGGIVKHPLAGMSFIEHLLPLTSAAAGTFDTSFNWTAPATGAGTITMYCTINSVNNNGSEDGGDVSGNTSITLSEGVSVPQLAANIGIKAYPNPVGDNLHIQLDHADAGTYSFIITDISGRNIVSQNATITAADYNTNINTSSLIKGFYLLQIVKDDAQRTIQLVKE